MRVDPAYLRRLAGEFEHDATTELRLSRGERTPEQRRRWLREAKRDNLIRVALLRYARDLEKGAIS